MFLNSKLANLTTIRLFSILALLALMSGLLAFAIKPVRAASGNLVINSIEVKLGQYMVISGRNFGADEKIALWATAPDNQVVDCGGIDADKNGVFTEVKTPCYIKAGPAGKWTLTAKGLSSGNTDTQPFGMLDSSIQGVATTADGITTVSVSGSDWFADPDTGFGEKVTIWFTIDGQVVPVGTADADTDGAIDVETTITPALTIGTVYKLTAYGNTSGRTLVVDVEVSEPEVPEEPGEPTEPGEGEGEE